MSRKQVYLATEQKYTFNKKTQKFEIQGKPKEVRVEYSPNSHRGLPGAGEIAHGAVTNVGNDIRVKRNQYSVLQTNKKGNPVGKISYSLIHNRPFEIANKSPNNPRGINLAAQGTSRITGVPKNEELDLASKVASANAANRAAASTKVVTDLTGGHSVTTKLGAVNFIISRKNSNNRIVFNKKLKLGTAIPSQAPKAIPLLTKTTDSKTVETKFNEFFKPDPTDANKFIRRKYYGKE